MPLALPSLGDAITVAQRTARRFPLALVAAIAAATSAVLQMEQIGRDWMHVRLLLTAFIGVPLFTALTLFAERLRRPWAAPALAGAGLVILGGFFAGYDVWSGQLLTTRFLLLGGASCLAVVVLPFARRGLPNALWQFTRIVLERAALAAAFALILFLGLALALQAVKNLFGVDVPEQAFFRMFVLCGLVIAPWYLLGGIPQDVDALEPRRDYPPVIRVLAQYVLVPLAAGYLVILTAYLFKVVVTWDWPSGWIGNLVTGVAVVGISAIVLTHPAEAYGEHRWVAAFARQFWFAILPSLVMLWLALYQRVQQYGLTEARFLGAVLSAWVAAVAVFYLVTRSRNILVLPASLAAVLLLMFGGPWGPFARSEASQMARIRALLERNGMLVGGSAVRAPRPVSDAERELLSGAVRYLVEVHGTDAMAPWFRDSVERHAIVQAGIQGRVHAEEGERWADVVLTHFGLRYLRPQLRGGELRFNYRPPVRTPEPLAGYDVLLSLGPEPGGAADTGYAARWTVTPLAVQVTHGADTLFLLPFDSAFARIRALDTDRSRPVWVRGQLQPKRIRGLTPAMFVLETANAHGRARVVLDGIGGTDSAGVARVDAVVGRVLVGSR